MNFIKKSLGNNLKIYKLHEVSSNRLGSSVKLERSAWLYGSPG